MRHGVTNCTAFISRMNSILIWMDRCHEGYNILIGPQSWEVAFHISLDPVGWRNIDGRLYHANCEGWWGGISIIDDDGEF